MTVFQLVQYASECDQQNITEHNLRPIRHRTRYKDEMISHVYTVDILHMYFQMLCVLLCNMFTVALTDT